MNGFIKQATGSKRIYLYMYIICTGGMVPSPLNREVQVETVARDIVPCSWARHFTQSLAPYPGV